MPERLLARAGASWLLLLALAFGNALLRERLLAPWLGPTLALPLSGLLLALLVVGGALLVTPWLLGGDPRGCRHAGLVWLLLTVAFEFPFGHYVLGRSWAELAAQLDVAGGNLMLPVLVVTAVAPCLAARLRGWGRVQPR